MTEEQKIKITKFGVYEIRGNISKIGYNISSKVSSHLYFNTTMQHFFLVKFFESGKCHIDFFQTYDSEMNYLENAYGKGDYVIGSCEGNIIKKELIYCYDTSSYNIATFDKDKVFVLSLKGC